VEACSPLAICRFAPSQTAQRGTASPILPKRRLKPPTGIADDDCHNDRDCPDHCSEDNPRSIGGDASSDHRDHGRQDGNAERSDSCPQRVGVKRRLSPPRQTRPSGPGASLQTNHDREPCLSDGEALCQPSGIPDIRVACRHLLSWAKGDQDHR